MTDLQGVTRVTYGPAGKRLYRVFEHGQRHVNHRYAIAKPRPAQRLSGRTKLWARYQDYNRPRKPKGKL